MKEPMPTSTSFSPSRSSSAPVTRIAALASLLCLCALAAHAQAPRFLVVPGKSVGTVKLGATRAQLRQLLGKPSETAARQYPRDTWLGAKLPERLRSMSARERAFLTVVYQNGRAAQIEFNDPRYQTRDGLSISSKIGDFRKKRAPLKKTVLAYTEGGGGFVDYYLDSVRSGIAFEAGTQDTYTETYTPNSIRIHFPGRPVIVDPGGTPTTE